MIREIINTIFAGVSGKAVRTQCTREARWRRGAAPERRVEGVPHRRCCLAGTCRWFKASGPLGSCWLWPRRPLFFGPQPDLGSVGLDIAPVPRERVEAHAAGHPLSGAIHAAFLPMQGVCVAPAPRCQRVWKHRGACQPSPAGVLERLRAALAGSPGAGNLAQAPVNDVPQPAWPSGLFRVDPRLARLHWATSLT